MEDLNPIIITAVPYDNNYWEISCAEWYIRERSRGLGEARLKYINIRKVIEDENIENRPIMISAPMEFYNCLAEEKKNSKWKTIGQITGLNWLKWSKNKYETKWLNCYHRTSLGNCKSLGNYESKCSFEDCPKTKKRRIKW